MNTQTYHNQTALTLNEFLRNLTPNRSANSWRWIEKDDSWKGELDLPGFEKEEVTVFIDKDRILSVTAQQTETEEEADFTRNKVVSHLRLPREINAEKLAAALESGVLRVTLPKVSPDSKIERQIELN